MIREPGVLMHVTARRMGGQALKEDLLYFATQELWIREQLCEESNATGRHGGYCGTPMQDYLMNFSA